MAPSDLTEPAAIHRPLPAEGLRRAADRWTDRWAARLARWEWVLWSLVLLALLADVATTLAGLQLGHAEGNPVVAGLLASAGVAGFLAIKVGVVALAACARLALPRYRVVIPLGTALPWLVAAGSNVALLLATA